MTCPRHLVAEGCDLLDPVARGLLHRVKERSPQRATVHHLAAAATVRRGIGIPEGPQLTDRGESGYLAEDLVDDGGSAPAPTAQIQDPWFFQVAR